MSFYTLNNDYINLILKEVYLIVYHKILIFDIEQQIKYKPYFKRRILNKNLHSI